MAVIGTYVMLLKYMICIIILIFLYDLGNKLDYLKAIVAYELIHPNLGEEFRTHIKEVAVSL